MLEVIGIAIMEGTMSLMVIMIACRVSELVMGRG